MSNQHRFNIFQQNYQEPDKNMALSLFSVVSNQNQNNENKQNKQRQRKNNKKQEFKNSIRKEQNQAYKRNRRQQMMRSLQSNQFFMVLQSLSQKNQVQSKNISNLLSDLRLNMNNQNFCKKLDENNRMKSYILNLYESHQKYLSIRQKMLMIDSLIFLTYFEVNTLAFDQKLRIIQMMIREIQYINQFECQEILYLQKMMDLLINVTSDQIQEINLYIINHRYCNIIIQKIDFISNLALKAEQQKNFPSYQKFVEDLKRIRQSFIQTIWNIIDRKLFDENFIKLILDQLSTDSKYLQYSSVTLVKILSQGFRNQLFRQIFITTQFLVKWFQNKIIPECQKRYADKDSIKTGVFNDYVMDETEKQLYYYLLDLFLIWINLTQDFQNYENYEYLNIMIDNNLNGYCLSQFLIQCAGNNSQGICNSKYVSKAIEMYQYLGNRPQISLQEMLIVISDRKPEDILKVLLYQKYFTSFKIAAETLQVIKCMFDRDPNIIQQFMELRLLDSIEAFLNCDKNFHRKVDIIKFLQLLSLILTGFEEQRGKCRDFIRLVDERGLLKKIERYQDENDRQIVEKVQLFLTLFELHYNENSKGRQREIQI